MAPRIQATIVSQILIQNKETAASGSISIQKAETPITSKDSIQRDFGSDTSHDGAGVNVVCEYVAIMILGYLGAANSIHYNYEQIACR